MGHQSLLYVDALMLQHDVQAGNLRKEERALADVSEYSTKRFRQVRGCCEGC